MKNRRNYYRILHVQRDAPAEIITTSYRTMMQRMKMHPDLGGDHVEAALVNEAYAILSDPERRAAYDSTLTATAADMRAAGFSAAEENEDATQARHAHTMTPVAGLCPFCQTPHHLEKPDADTECSHCLSPLFPVQHEQGSFAAQRAIERMPKELPVTFCLNGRHERSMPGIMLDLSPIGMRLITDQKMSMGNIVKIQCDLFSAVGRVRRYTVSSSDRGLHAQAGIEFITLRFKAKQGSFVSVNA